MLLACGPRAGPGCASGKNLRRGMSYIGRIRLQAVDDAQENASWYGEGVSAARIYAYVGNDPLKLTDPSGLYFGIDDLLFSGGGALLGLGAQAVHDVVAGQLSSKGAYAGAILGGAASGSSIRFMGGFRLVENASSPANLRGNLARDRPIIVLAMFRRF
ncbi:MAG: type secretion protein ImpA [Rhodopila sp.]|jgi:hypothetical protein|nr:type secretion protein ImpA [Rhodopila sp.]